MNAALAWSSASVTFRQPTHLRFRGWGVEYMYTHRNAYELVPMPLISYGFRLPFVPVEFECVLLCMYLGWSVEWVNE